jgi:DNA-binding IclR family transcriptional regulator
MSNGQIQSLDRGLRILDELAARGPELGVTDLALRLGVHKSTASRLLATLRDHDLVDQNPQTEKFRLAHGLVRLARALLQELGDATRETVNLAVADGDLIVHIDQITPPQQVVNVNWVGKHVPLHCTSNGKVLLAWLPQKDRTRILRRALQRYTPRTIVDPKLLAKQLERVREDGYAFTLGELEVGLNAVAAPVRSPDGDAVAVVSVSGPSYRVTPQLLTELGERTRDVADAISRRLGGNVGAPPPALRATSPSKWGRNASPSEEDQ